MPTLSLNLFTIVYILFAASGIGLGIVFSVLFFKRRPWPVVFGLGVGLGKGYGNCEHDFGHPDFLYGKLRKVEAKPPVETK